MASGTSPYGLEKTILMGDVRKQDTIYSVSPYRRVWEHRRRGNIRVEEFTRLPAFNYYLDESDPDIAILRRQDGSFVAAFSAQGATKEGIVEAAKDDYRALLTREIENSDDFGIIRGLASSSIGETKAFIPPDARDASQ
jgi:hypothetical protein